MVKEAKESWATGDYLGLLHAMVASRSRDAIEGFSYHIFGRESESRVFNIVVVVLVTIKEEEYTLSMAWRNTLVPCASLKQILW